MLTVHISKISNESVKISLQEVLGEIQRLKAEASRFIAILSQEEEYEKSDQQLSPTKKQSLTKEVESLQVKSSITARVAMGSGTICPSRLRAAATAQ